MTTARTELPYPCKSHAKTGDESSGGGGNVTGQSPFVEYVGITY